MTQHPKARLLKPIGRHLRRGHPWVFADAISVPEGTTTGAIIDIHDAADDFVARGLYDADSPLAVRVWTNDAGEELDSRLVANRVRDAWQLRERVVPLHDTDGYRLLHGESDRMPAIVADRYGDTAVLMLDTPSAGRMVPLVAAALLEHVPDLARIVIRSRVRGGGPAHLRVLAGGPPPEPLLVKEHGMIFEVDLARGHKTGLYLDQRENRRRLIDLASERHVLNLFAYTGGFSVAAALGGAREVTTIDIAAPAIEAAQRNFAHNGLAPGDPGYRFKVGDALTFLEKGRERWNLIVLDPPSMAPSRASRQGALARYRKLNARAMQRLERGGLLMTFSCSSHIGAADLARAVHRAAGDAGRRIEVHETFGAAPDHPVLRNFPEGDYLHGMLVEVLGGYAHQVQA
jgi:23S rRNA (cytosine1962-C5)-methyltransferase